MIPFQVQAGKPLRAIVCDRSGATAVEFAFIAPVFLTMVMGIMDFGHSVYARAELNGSVQQAARSSTMETSDTSVADNMVRSYLETIVPGVEVASTRANYYDFTDVGRAERWNDLNNNGQCDNAETFVDENESGDWDADIGRSGNGGASDVVVYTVTATYTSPFSVPFYPESWKQRTLVASTTLKNQPYAYQIAYGSSTGVC